MRMKEATTPTYIDLHSTHRIVLKLLQKKTGRTLRSLVTEAIEDLAVRYEVVSEKQHIYTRTDWIPVDGRKSDLQKELSPGENKYI